VASAGFAPTQYQRQISLDIRCNQARILFRGMCALSVLTLEELLQSSSTQ
jgi:hypothetical protein